jgi:hypothetical protein
MIELLIAFAFGACIGIVLAVWDCLIHPILDLLRDG